MSRHLQRVCFNSLFEMPSRARIGRVSAPFAMRFNSLFEMQNACVSQLGGGGLGSARFNSLFEMPGLVEF